ncbi:MAG TPA: MBL fold metallo-hydrolase [Acidimicrobiia bacterium]|nr:MBL fold metallo-hydrolase [Acidimicrobiia bacterium]
MDLTVLGCSGSYGAPVGGACSGYLVRAGNTTVWLDCGNGTFVNLQQHVAVEDLDAVVITHEHPDHCVDLYGLHVLFHYGLERTGFPVYVPEGLDTKLGVMVGGDWGSTFDWHAIGDGDGLTLGDLAVRFSRTDHPPPTYAVEMTGDGRRLVYTADTGPNWTVGAFGDGADLVLSEATYQEGDKGWALHLTAAEAGKAAREAGARRLMLTHLWPQLDAKASVEEGSDAFGDAVTLAAPHLVTTI